MELEKRFVDFIMDGRFEDIHMFHVKPFVGGCK